MDKQKSNLWYNLRRLRSSNAYSQERLADELKITKSRIASYEENRAEPPIWLLIKIASFFKISVDELIK